MDSVVKLHATESSDTDNGSDTENDTRSSRNDRNDTERTTDLHTRAQGSSNLKAGQIIKYVKRDTGVSYTAKVRGRAGKSTGQYKN